MPLVPETDILESANGERLSLMRDDRIKGNLIASQKNGKLGNRSRVVSVLKLERLSPRELEFS